MVTKTPEELDSMREEIRLGKLPADAMKNYLAEEAQTVFGHDFKTRGGKPVEQGIGSPGRESENHYASIRKYEGPEAERRARAAAAKHRAPS